MFEIKNITKKYSNEFALNDVSFEIGKGLNFIVGASGSGKTTLLKIISGMEQKFDGDVFYNGESIKLLSEKQKSYLYNNVFGFVWQDFNLIEDLTVSENIAVPQYLKNSQNKNEIIKVLKQLKISELADQKVSKLSGGQRQRVAIARELVKNPEVIIADEPTSALDEKTSKATMDILRDIAKTRTVIVVTHDISLINARSNVYELDKGELISKSSVEQIKASVNPIQSKHKLTVKNAFNAAIKNCKNKLARFFVSSMALVVSAVLILVSVSGAVSNSGQDAFNKLFDTYGDGILDISVVGSFMSASGGDEDEPNADVTQDIGGLYDKYLDDGRIQHIVMSQAFSDIKINVDGNNLDVESSGNVPAVNKLTAGKMPMGADNEVVIPNSLVKKLGMTDEEMIGKELDFEGGIYNWSSGEPILMNIKITAKIVGVIDTKVVYDYEGQLMEYSIDDSFFFSKAAIDNIRSQAQIEGNEANFTIRAKSPADMIAIKNELNAAGIVPLGRFELVEDMVKLNEQTAQQSGSATIIIGILSVAVAIAITAVTAIMRRREYAIYKVSGFNNTHLSLLNLVEYSLISTASVVLFLITLPIINIATKSAFNADILDLKLIVIGGMSVIAVGILCWFISTVIAVKTSASAALKTGEK